MATMSSIISPVFVLSLMCVCVCVFVAHFAVKRAARLYGAGVGDSLLDDIQCSGNELDLLQCTHSGIFKSNCTHSEDAGVVCGGV